jgi:hypothetical protein
MRQKDNAWFTLIFGGLAIILFIIFILLQGCTTGLPGTHDIYGRRYEVPIEMKAPDTLAAGAVNYQ